MRKSSPQQTARSYTDIATGKKNGADPAGSKKRSDKDNILSHATHNP